MRISQANKEVFTSGNANSISQYNFSQCLNLLHKLKHLDSHTLQSPYYQFIIRTLEGRIKRLAHNKAPQASLRLPAAAGRVMV